MVRLRLKKGDKVIIIAGKDKGKTGILQYINHDKRRVIVQGLQIAKKHGRVDEANPEGIRDKEMFIAYSNVQLYDESVQKGTRIGIKRVDGVNSRYSKKSGKDL